jgi:serine/threonine-protein kinase HSL1, negative regulator of Swe1 kinase
LSFIPLALNIKPVSVAVELFTVLHHGRKANLSLARFTQEKGAKSSFERVIVALESTLTARGLLVEGEEKRAEMKAVLVGDGGR